MWPILAQPASAQFIPLNPGHTFAQCLLHAGLGVGTAQSSQLQVADHGITYESVHDSLLYYLALAALHGP